MAKVKQIEAFETSDGRIFKKENIAKAEQRKIELRTKLNSLVQRECWNNMHKEDILDFLVENVEQIETIFKS